MSGNELQAFLDSLQKEKHLHVAKVSKLARPWLAAELARRAQAPILLVTAEENESDAAFAAARLFAGDDRRQSADPFSAQVVQFPLHQLVPYEDLSPDPSALVDRISLLFRLLQGAPPKLMVASILSLLRLGIPRKALDSASLLILKGQTVDREVLARSLVRAGYLNVPLVEDCGSFAIRGGTIDIFGPPLPWPVRIELLGDEVESIRSFEPGSQRTKERLESVYLGPAREILHDEQTVAHAIGAIDRLAHDLDVTSSRLMAQRRALKESVRYFGVESLLPAFYPTLESLFDYLPPGTLLLVDDMGAVMAAAQKGGQRLQTAYEEARDKGELVFDPSRLLLPKAELEQRLSAGPRLSLGVAEEPDTPETQLEFRTQDVVGLRQEILHASSEKHSLQPLLNLLAGWRRQGIRPFLVASRPGRARQLAQLLRERGVAVRLETGPFDPQWQEQLTPNLGARIIEGDLPGGFFCLTAGVGFVPDADIFGRPAPPTRAKQMQRPTLSLKKGDRIVHADFGIGQFEGLIRLQVSGLEADYLLLTYQGGDRLYLPVFRMNLLERYTGPEGASPPLSKLGGTSWEKAKLKVHQALLEMANELVRLDAIRRAQPGIAADEPGEPFRALEASFPFEETEDQRRAIEDVLADMRKPKVMDRLVCGDVGFGKTEVAVRAAFLCALSGRQTAVLVPTTILALQHQATFRARLEPFAIRVEMVSRLVPAAEQKAILQDAALGKVDVIIGTHRLLRQDAGFKSLGLLIIDEEHRFGVGHKEKIKQLRKNVDVLTMTATPLPRTLQLSLSGLRDVSVIQTPPQGRRSIRTFITRFSRRVIVEAVQRELSRGGQVFFVHNWVKSLPGMQRYLNKVVPEARTAVAHGQMSERELERVMTGFVRRDIDVLLCTSIIESGLDIPSANTILVNRADHFGLAQLYQIRGRVGRSGERAYAYLLIPGMDAITADARERLEVLSEFTELGSGYRIASQDLELRGAGNMLGKAQSGHIAAVGFELYSRLLERAIMEVKGQSQGAGTEPEINLPVAGYLAEDYLTDQDQRLDLYSRISRAEREEELWELEREMVDRYGPATPEAANLFEMMSVKLLLKKLQIAAIDAKGGRINLQLGTASKIDPKRLVALIHQEPDRYSLDPQGFLHMKLGGQESLELIPAVRLVLARLAGEQGQTASQD